MDPRRFIYQLTITRINNLQYNTIINDPFSFHQVASCTLDAGVKIYSYRVDSVHKDTFKVLGSLGGAMDAKDDEDEEGGAGGEGGEADGEEGSQVCSIFIPHVGKNL